MTVKIFVCLIVILFLVKSVQNLSIECNFQYVGWIAIGTAYTCRTIQISNLYDKNVNFINGSHINDLSDSNVSAIFFEDEIDLSFLPRNLNDFFPNLILINSWNTHFNEISSEQLRHFPDLQVFSIGQSSIKSLPFDLFQFNRNLIYIGIDNSQFLENIGENFLGGLWKLEIASFGHNRCINEIAYGYESIQELNRKLHISCSSISQSTSSTTKSSTSSSSTKTTTTTTTLTTTNSPDIDSCPLTCLYEIEKFENIIQKQQEELKNITERMYEMEKILLELTVRP